VRINPELAWAAGLFVGEGCITVTRTYNSSGTYPYLRLDMRMYDERAVRRFIAATGANYHRTFSKQRQHVVHGAAAVGRSAERILATLWPYIADTEKGEQALSRARELGVEDWVTGVRTDARPQSNERRRGRIPVRKAG
jgi:hypothetical protein